MRPFILIQIGIILCRQLIAQDAANIYNKSVYSTVTIETDLGLGSGFFIGENIIITNFHVIEGAATAFCYTNNDATRYEIEGFLAYDKTEDLILLKVKNLNRPALNLASTTVTPGQKVYVLGSPKGLPASISDGIVSGLRDFDGYKLIQITAPISPGSSGGPVLNSKGELIGVAVCQLKDGQNLNFAIPKSNVELLLNFKKEYPTSITSISYPVADIDGNVYGAVKIGTQIWMAENMRYKASSGCWVYNNDENNLKKYGYLYSWEAARKVCPSGWHLPSESEFLTLIKFLGGEDVAGGKLKSAQRWDCSESNKGATNESGFAAVPGGYRLYDGSYTKIGVGGYWWSYTEKNAYNVWIRNLNCWTGNIYKFSESKQEACSVRCIKD